MTMVMAPPKYHHGKIEEDREEERKRERQEVPGISFAIPADWKSKILHSTQA